MATNTPNYNLKKPAPEDFYNIADFNGNMDTLDTALKSVETTAGGKANAIHTHATSDITGLDSGLSSLAPATIAGTSAPSTSTVGAIGQHYLNTASGVEYVCTAVSGNTYTWKKVTATTAADVGAVPETRTVNGKALSADITLSAGDIAGSQPTSMSVTLLASGWDATAQTQTVSVSGVSANESEQLIHPVPALINQAEYYEAGIMCIGQAANSLTFEAEAIPSGDLIIYIAIQQVNAV